MTIGTLCNIFDLCFDFRKERNREQGSDNLSLPLTGAETQYSLNLQLQSNLQQQDRENTTIRSNIITNEMSQQVDNLWEEAHSSFRLSSATNDDNLFNNLRFESFSRFIKYNYHIDFILIFYINLFFILQ